MQILKQGRKLNFGQNDTDQKYPTVKKRLLCVPTTCFLIKDYFQSSANNYFHLYGAVNVIKHSFKGAMSNKNLTRTPIHGLMLMVSVIGVGFKGLKDAKNDAESLRGSLKRLVNP